VSELPGPGIYEQKSTIGQGPRFTIKEKRNDKDGNDNPGPGNYEANTDVIKDKVISHKISSSQRVEFVSKEA
jgi:hypothetical protein